MDSEVFTGNGGSTVAAGFQVQSGGDDCGASSRAAYPGGGAGGKLRGSRRGSNKKSTPYDRPSTSRHTNLRPPPSSVEASSSSMTSRIVNSASRLITSSASYIFSSFYGRKPPPAITQGSLHRVEEEGFVEENNDADETMQSPAEQDAEEEHEEDTEKEEEEDVREEGRADEYTENGRAVNQQQILNVKMVAAQHNSSGFGNQGTGMEKKPLDITRLEEILKQKSLSREEVNRLTSLLQSQVNGSSSTPVQPVQKAKPIVEKELTAIETPIRRMEETPVPVSEAQRWREELKKARSDLTPIEVARAYMGERTAMPAGLTLTLQGTSHQIDKVSEHQPASAFGVIGDRYRTSPFIKSVTRSPVVRMPKRNSLLEEDWMSVGPVRRTRQRAFQMGTSPCPYARPPPPRDSVVPRSYATQPVQSSQTARKILDTLEKLTPAKGRSLDEEFAMERTPVPHTADLFNSQTRKGTRTTELSRFSSMKEPGVMNGRLDFGSMSKTREFGSISRTPVKLPTLTFGTPKENIQTESKLPSYSESAFSSPIAGVSSKFSNGSQTPNFPCTTPANGFGAFAPPAASQENMYSPAAVPTPVPSVPSKSLTDTAAEKDFSFGGQPVMPNSSLLSFSRSEMASSRTSNSVGSSPSASKDTAAETTSKTSSAVGAPLNLFSFAKPTSNNLFGSMHQTNSITNSSPTIETTNASFTFSTSTVPVTSCSKSTFGFGSGVSSPSLTSTFSSTPQSNASDKSIHSPPSCEEDSNSLPVFSFTSPKGGKLVPPGPIESLSPEPKFTFGSGGASSLPSASIASSGQLSSSFLFGGQTGNSSGQSSSSLTMFTSSSSFSFGGQIGSSSSGQSSASLTSSFTFTSQTGTSTSPFSASLSSPSSANFSALGTSSSFSFGGHKSNNTPVFASPTNYASGGQIGNSTSVFASPTNYASVGQIGNSTPVFASPTNYATASSPALGMANTPSPGFASGATSGYEKSNRKILRPKRRR